MKNFIFLIVVLISNSFLFCQEKIIQKRSILKEEFEIVTYGLDDIVLENSENDELEVVLYDENPNTHNILFKEEESVLKIEFELNFLPIQDGVFRKYITKRLQRAWALVKIPKNKKITLHGKTIGVTSKSYQGELSIYIERGNVQLNTISRSTIVHLFQGNVFAKTSNVGLNFVTNKGAIIINEEKKVSPYRKTIPSSLKHLTINSIHANINIQAEQ
ncbi:hypothetical protein [Tenacibaculum caenipelagi]|uniref:Uncharacterized protein n=1 Tax=Tenacibaculum caenipelagi TaxID=1325435 RepID=A0A4R6TCR1_9FLAO|nr:hypothetical protein [Tenacibaculum caenipelagi]TDQ21985.1 hypothetical protein DFQ07_3082 [Tenacibaculum caenipelagi]